MTGKQSLLIWCMTLAMAGCQDMEQGAPNCVGNCDNSSDIGQLMPRAPDAVGMVNITRNQGAWLFEVIGAKGDIVLLSQAYADKTSSINGILSVEENGLLPEQYLIRKSPNGWDFVLRARNNEPIADSQSYASEEEAKAGALEARELIAGIVQYNSALSQGARFELLRLESDWIFELRSEDDTLLLKSQSYTGRTDAITGIESVRRNGKEAARYTLLKSPHRFILKATNGREIAQSGKSFPSAEEAQAAIDATKELLLSRKAANPW